MATHVALLRGINLGGKNKVAMADLRALVGELGHADVSTYIQSGNVLFTAEADADTSVLAAGLTTAIAATLKVSSPVVVVSREELAQIIAANPFPAEPDPKRVHAVVLSEPPWPDLTVKLDAARAKSAAGRRARPGAGRRPHALPAYARRLRAERASGGGAAQCQLAQVGRDRHRTQLGNHHQAARTVQRLGDVMKCRSCG